MWVLFKIYAVAAISITLAILIVCIGWFIGTIGAYIIHGLF